MSVFLITIFLLIFILLAALIIAGNFFVSFALDNKASFDLFKKISKENLDVDLPIVDHTPITQWLKQYSVDKYIISKDNLKLHGFYVENEKKSHKYLIGIHGYKGRAEEVGPSGLFFYNKGYNILLPDNRAFHGSEGRYIGMGTLECYDVLYWINSIIKEDEKAEIVIHGVSMGGATVMLTTGLDLPSNVKFAIEDCGYVSVWEILKDKLKQFFHLPSFPILTVCSIIAKIRAGYSFKEGDCIKAVKKSKTPTLFIHGEKDTFIPVTMMETLFSAAECKKEKFVCPDAEHALSMYTHPDLYFKAVDEFEKMYMN